MSCADDEEFSQPGEEADEEEALAKEEAKLKAQLAQLQRKRKSRSSGGSLSSESIYGADSSSSSTAAAAAAAPSGSPRAVTVTAGASASHNNQTVSINGTVIHFNGPVQFTALQRMRCSHITRQHTKDPVWKPVLKECFLNRLSEAAWRKFFDSTKPSHQAAFRGSHKAKSLQKTGITVSACR